MFGPLMKYDIPMVSGDHPKIDSYVVLTGKSHYKYQMVVGILNCIVALGRLDIGFACSSLYRFTGLPSSNSNGSCIICLWLFEKATKPSL